MRYYNIASLALLISIFVFSAHAEPVTQTCKIMNSINVCIPKSLSFNDKGNYIELKMDISWEAGVEPWKFYNQQILSIVDSNGIQGNYHKCESTASEDMDARSYCETNPMNHYQWLKEAFNKNESYTYPDGYTTFNLVRIGDIDYMKGDIGMEGASVVTSFVSFIKDKIVYFKITTVGDGYHINEDDINSYISQITFNTVFFPDIPTSHPHAEAIQYVKEQGIVEGYEDGTYRPENTINRAEFTKILLGASVHAGSISGSNCFPDVQDQWFASFVCTAKLHSIIAGYPDGTFHPAESINTAEAAKIIVNTFNLPVPPGLPTDAWYTSYMSALGNAGALPSTANSPEHLLTRGEMAEVIYRLKKGNL